MCSSHLNTDNIYECSYCGAKFKKRILLNLHKGDEHYADLTEEEKKSYSEAYEKENKELRLLRLKSLAALVATYFLLLFAYSLFT